MTSGTNFWDGSVWSFLIAVTILFAGMIAATVLRNTIRPLQKLMIPSAVLGGFLILLAKFLLKELADVTLLDTAMLEMLTYHGLGLGFVAMALRNLDRQRDTRARVGGFDTGAVVVSTYLIQAVLGLIITVGLYYALGSFFASGLLLPMGYGQGPGQAYNWGHNYEALFGFESGTSFGLTVAAMGFVSASVGGVIALNAMRRKGAVSRGPDGNVVDEDLSAQRVTAPGEVPLSEAMDKFTIQLALVFMSYILAYIFMRGVDLVIETGVMGDFGYNTVRPLIWGFNFLFGTIFALGVKAFLRLMRRKNIIKREYTNTFMQNRIAGFMFDIMVVASIAAIDLSAFTRPDFIIPLTLICLAGAAVTYFYLKFICRRVFPGYEKEAFLSLYGMLTGTASTGVILLREVDPRFESQAASNLVYHQPWAIVFGFPMLLLLSVAPQSPGRALLTLGILAALFAAMNVIVLRRDIFRGKKS